MFSSEFCEISKNTFFCRTLLVAAFVYFKLLLFQGGLDQLIKTDQNMVTKRTCKDSVKTIRKQLETIYQDAIFRCIPLV